MISTPLLLGIESILPGDAERKLFERLRPAGYVLLARNLETPEQTRALTDRLRAIDPGLDPIIASSPESLAAILPRTPAPAELAATGKPADVADCGAFTGDLLRLLGINLCLGPRLDLDRPGHPGHPERWHHDPQRVIDHAGTWNRWLRKHKVRSAAMAFPAGGLEPGGNASVTDLLARELVPYTALMPELDAIVVGHQTLPAIDPDFPASLSKRIVTRLLRDQLGFDRHLVLTEDLGKPEVPDHFPAGGAVTAAFRAGVDLAVWALEPDVEQAVAGLRDAPGPLLQDADRRIERFRERLHDPLPWSDDRWKTTCDKLPVA